jgi:pyridoxamine 5'-phosphate oxidase
MTDRSPISVDLFDRRKEYRSRTLDESSVDPDPLRQFARWMEEAESAEVPEATAMVLATTDGHGHPTARVVLLKAVDRGFVFFTDYRSDKAMDIAANPHVAMVFFWQPLERQVRVIGIASQVSPEESDRYFATRPQGSQIGAWASRQSDVIPDRHWLEQRWETAAQRFAGSAVPRPDHWGGYRVHPTELEFWQGRESRLHDRIHYQLENDAWRVSRLSP